MNKHRDGDEPLVVSLLGAAHAIEARLEGVLNPLGLSLARLGVLRALDSASEPMPLSELATRLACVRSNITQIVDRLEKDGLVKRRPDPADRRSVRAELTAAGKRAVAEGWAVFSAEQRTIVAAVGAGAADNIKSALELLVR